ncbi:MAG: SGNH/GDSL hydrolase family protein [Bacilli bacterium]
MGKIINKFLLLSTLLFITSCSTNNPTSEDKSSESTSLVEESSDDTIYKTIYFPTDVNNPASDTGVDVCLGYDEYRLTKMYVGEGVEEEITHYTYNENICEIDNLGRVTPKTIGSSRCFAHTKSGKKYEFKVNVLAYEGLREWIRESAAYMKEEYTKVGPLESPYVFFGDSFFDPRGFWTDFYSTFSSYNAFVTGIGTARTNDWMTIKKENLLDLNPKSVFINLGVNNAIAAGDNSKTLAAKLIALFEELHYQKPDMEIYYYGIIHSGEQSWNSISDGSNEIIEEYALSKSYLTYLDIPSLVNPEISKYLKSDNLHPNDACYELYASLAKEHMTNGN